MSESNPVVAPTLLFERDLINVTSGNGKANWPDLVEVGPSSLGPSSAPERDTTCLPLFGLAAKGF